MIVEAGTLPTPMAISMTQAMRAGLHNSHHLSAGDQHHRSQQTSNAHLLVTSLVT